MPTTFIVIMVLYSAGMACGQVLFKLAAMKTADAGPGAGMLAFVNIYLAVGLVLYAGLTVLWVWLLRSVPLSKAYPFVALSFIFTPLLSRLVFGDTLNMNYFGGLFLIACGIIVIVRV